jgi:iron complex outermembrane receptor protein
LEEQTVTATNLTQDELSYAAPVEIYTSQDIENSKSKSIYDFLNQETSLAVLPTYGNQFAQKIDMRGYGIGNGHQNIVVVINGRRMNNIDNVPQLLSSIPIDSINKIEILKGAGSVEYGDGANAGVISITTRDFNGVNIKTYGGNFGTGYGSLGAGYADELFSISAFGDYFETDGQRDLDASSNRQDSSRSKNGSFDLKLYPADDLELRAGWAATRINTNYANPLTLDEYKADPTQAGSGYTNQHFNTDLWSFGVSYELTTNWSLDTNLYLEDKSSDYGSSSSQTDYDYNSGDLNLKYADEAFRITVGTAVFNGERYSKATAWSAESLTSKDSIASFIETSITQDDHTLTLGARIEKVTYAYNPTGAGTNQKNDHVLEAYELGYSHKLTDEQSVFTSFAHSFQAPDIDRFFTTDNTTTPPTKKFNGFIEPMKANTYNIGYNYFLTNNKLKATVFYVDLSNEIYYTGGWTGVNTNLDQTSKLGLELSDKYLISDKLYISANYTYIEATIEKDDNKDIEDKTLPGVSKHNLVASIGYAPTQASKLIASHSYRSSAYATDDFTNSFSQKQEAYNSTDVTASYQYDEHIEVFAKIQNLLDEDNGIWTQDDAIYPVNFQRSFQIGLNAIF